MTQSKKLSATCLALFGFTFDSGRKSSWKLVIGFGPLFVIPSGKMREAIMAYFVTYRSFK